MSDIYAEKGGKPLDWATVVGYFFAIGLPIILGGAIYLMWAAQQEDARRSAELQADTSEAIQAYRDAVETAGR